MGLVLVTPAAVQLIDTATAKLWCRADATATPEDEVFDELVASATEQAEKFLQRPILESEWRFTFDSFPGCRSLAARQPGHLSYDDLLRLPLGGVSAVTEIGYVDTDGVSQVIDNTSGAGYLTDLSEPVARIQAAYGTFWPTSRSQLGACYVKFTAGWHEVDDVPKSIVSAVKLMLADLYSNREDTSQNQHYTMPNGAERLLWPWRVWPLRNG